MAEVRFIRKHGRIIPIRAKQPQQPKIVAPVVAAAAGVATYLALRKFRVSPNVKLAGLQNLVNKKGLSVVTPRVKTPLGKAIVTAIFGVKPNVKGAVQANVYQGFGKGKDAINPQVVSNLIDDKLAFAQAMGKLSPETTTFKQGILSKLKGFKKKDFLIKPRHGSNAAVTDFATKAELFSGHKKARAAFHSPEGHLIQEKLDITKEYRAHILNGEVFGISHRRIPNKTLRNLYGRGGKLTGGGAFIPVFGKDRAAVKELAAQVGKKISKKVPGENYFVALDIAKTPKGFKVIEGNTSPGTLGNPLVSRKFVKLATGRTPKEVALGASAIVGAATYKAVKPKEKQNARRR